MFGFGWVILTQTLPMTQGQHPRRKFLLTGLAGFCTAVFANFPQISFAKSNKNKVRTDEEYANSEKKNGMVYIDPAPVK